MCRRNRSTNQAAEAARRLRFKLRPRDQARGGCGCSACSGRTTPRGPAHTVTQLAPPAHPAQAPPRPFRFSGVPSPISLPPPSRRPLPSPLHPSTPRSSFHSGSCGPVSPDAVHFTLPPSDPRPARPPAHGSLGVVVHPLEGRYVGKIKDKGAVITTSPSGHRTQEEEEGGGSKSAAAGDPWRGRRLHQSEQVLIHGPAPYSQGNYKRTGPGP